jgi:hypothetical protein
MKTFLAGISLLLLTTGASLGTPLTVTSHDDSGPGTLRDAIANAAQGDSIVFELPSPDTITLTTDKLLIDKDLTITGPGADLLTVARSGANGTPPFTIFDIFQGAVTINGLTISNGDSGTAPFGGGLHTRSSLEVVLSGCRFTNNRAGSGGGFATEGPGSSTLLSCTFIGNTAAPCGGRLS